MMDYVRQEISISLCWSLSEYDYFGPSLMIVAAVIARATRT